MKRYNLSSTYFSNYKKAWSEDRTNFTEILFKCKGKILSLSSLIFMAVWIFFYMRMSLCYTSTWLCAKFLKGCKLSRAFGSKAPGVSSHRFMLPSIPPSVCGPTAKLKLLWLGWLSQVLLFVLVNLLWLQLSVQHSSRCGTKGFYTVRGCAKYNAALLYQLQGRVVFPGVGLSLYCHSWF